MANMYILKTGVTIAHCQLSVFIKIKILFFLWFLIYPILLNSQPSKQSSENFLTFYHSVYKSDNSWARIKYPLPFYVNDTLNSYLTDTLVSEHLIKVSKFVDTAFHKVTISIEKEQASVQCSDKITGIDQTECFIRMEGKWFMQSLRIELPPDSILKIKINNLFNLVVEKLKSKDFDTSLPVLNYLIKYTPHIQNYYSLRAWIFQEKEQFAKAIDDYAMAIDEYDIPEAYFQRAYCFNKTGDYKSALDDLNYLLRNDHSHLHGYLARSIVYNALSDSFRSANDLNHALELAINDSLAFRNIAIEAYQMNHFEIALKAARAFSEIDNNDDLTNNIIFDSYLRLGLSSSGQSQDSIFEIENFDLFNPDTSLVFNVSSYFVESNFMDPDSLKSSCINIYFKRIHGNLQMINAFEKKNSNSFGKISHLRLSEFIQHSNKNYASKEYRFVWHYRNSYDNNKGKCLGKLYIVFSSNKPEYRLTLFVLKNRYPLIMKGNILKKGK